MRDFAERVDAFKREVRPIVKNNHDRNVGHPVFRGKGNVSI
ncbi:MAG: hypothetical protein FD139_3072 [Methylocystaceae bacterium]|nr:MAG: hypothetical protein FD139_3072 [Methylocystaceae bacterium]